MNASIKKGRMLTDEHINYAQNLLVSQFPSIDGFQNCLLAQNNGFVPVQREAIQIHFVRGNHWVTSSLFGGVVTVYDSLCEGTLSVSLTHQLALVYRAQVRTDDQTLCAYVPTVQQQQGGVDCGVFAIAFALHIALGDDLENIIFEQSSMRQHLLTCFSEQKFEPFPCREIVPSPSPHKQPNLIKLYCTCLMPETYDDMIACDVCERWFHLKCVGMPQSPPEEESWICKNCTA